MRVHLPTEEGCFNIISNTFCNLECYLITPQIDAKWNKNNLFYRSLITDKEGNVLSSGFPKFFNYGEKPDCYPDPENFNDWKIEEKIDGSLLIADYVNGQFSMRTRGTVSYSSQENAKDFELLPEKYPEVVDFLKENQHLSLLFEIVTPNNVIVVRPQQVEFYLIGAINKNEMRVASSHDLLEIWREIGPIYTPHIYNFIDTKDLSKIAENIKHWRGKEGIVISYNNGQNRIKLKSDWYLFIHRVKSQLNSENNLIEYYVDSGMPKYLDFYKKVETEFDYEIALQLTSQINKICTAGEKVKMLIENMKEFLSSIRGFQNRKQQAEHIIDTYGSANRASFVFHMLNGKELTKEHIIKLLHQNLKHENYT